MLAAGSGNAADRLTVCAAMGIWAAGSPFFGLRAVGGMKAVPEPNERFCRALLVQGDDRRRKRAFISLPGSSNIKNGGTSYPADCFFLQAFLQMLREFVHQPQIP